jgi:hypothetical protein
MEVLTSERHPDANPSEARVSGGPAFVSRSISRVGANGVSQQQVLRSLRSHQDDGYDI